MRIEVVREGGMEKHFPPRLPVDQFPLVTFMPDTKLTSAPVVYGECREAYPVCP